MDIPKEINEKTGAEFLYASFHYLIEYEDCPVEEYWSSEETDDKGELERVRIFIVLKHGDKTQGWDVAFVWEKTEEGEFFSGASDIDVLDETTSKKEIWDYIFFHTTD